MARCPWAPSCCRNETPFCWPSGIFVLTLLLVICQPRGLGIGWSASLGALLALAAGVVHWSDIPVVWDIVGNATATFIAIIVISVLMD